MRVVRCNLKHFSFLTKGKGRFLRLLGYGAPYRSVKE